jgi:hypothetical protein
MLTSCLVLGCAISSFAYRRQEQDRYQTVIFIIAIGTASTLGLMTGVGANLVMLGLIPWALCLAMVLSSCLHRLVKRYNNHRGNIYCDIDEQEVLLPY